MDRREVVLEDVVLKSMSAVNGGVGDRRRAVERQDFRHRRRHRHNEDLSAAALEDHDLAQREVLDVRRRRGQRDVAPREYRGLDKPPLRCLKDVFARSVVLLDEIECPVAEEDGRLLRRDNELPRRDADCEEDRSVDRYVQCTARSGR